MTPFFHLTTEWMLSMPISAERQLTTSPMSTEPPMLSHRFFHDPPTNCNEVEFALWAAAYRRHRAEHLIHHGIRADRIRQMLDLEVDAARRRTRAIETEVRSRSES